MWHVKPSLSYFVKVMSKTFDVDELATLVKASSTNLMHLFLATMYCMDHTRRRVFFSHPYFDVRHCFPFFFNHAPCKLSF